jgi:hypothetical protein
MYQANSHILQQTFVPNIPIYFTWGRGAFYGNLSLGKSLNLMLWKGKHAQHLYNESSLNFGVTLPKPFVTIFVFSFFGNIGHTPKLEAQRCLLPFYSPSQFVYMKVQLWAKHMG